MTAYTRGREFEYRTKKHLEALGYFVLRSPASKSPVDLIALGEDVKLVQCKLSGKFPKKEREELTALTAKVKGASAWLARPGAKRRGVELIQVDA